MGINSKMIYDLHNLTHNEARIEVAETLLTASYVGSFEITFITGKSDQMRNIVINICEEHDFNYIVPANNQGKIIVNYFSIE